LPDLSKKNFLSETWVYKEDKWFGEFSIIRFQWPGQPMGMSPLPNFAITIKDDCATKMGLLQGAHKRRPPRNDSDS